jgi:hypothetical protein
MNEAQQAALAEQRRRTLVIALDFPAAINAINAEVSRPTIAPTTERCVW